jgi:hypothetical protein
MFLFGRGPAWQRVHALLVIVTAKHEVSLQIHVVLPKIDRFSQAFLAIIPFTFRKTIKPLLRKKDDLSNSSLPAWQRYT